MNVFTRATFDAACDGNPLAKALLVAVAKEGSKSAEGILLQLTRENQAATGERDFAAAFARVSAANPELHRAYLNAIG